MTSSAFIYCLGVDFKVDVVGPRERRAMLLIGAALAAIIAASGIYLHPAATEAPIVVKAPTTTGPVGRPVIILNPGTDVYFSWRLAVIGGSGGHRAG
jgi:hypothetical protein